MYYLTKYTRRNSVNNPELDIFLFIKYWSQVGPGPGVDTDWLVLAPSVWLIAIKIWDGGKNPSRGWSSDLHWAAQKHELLMQLT